MLFFDAAELAGITVSEELKMPCLRKATREICPTSSSKARMKAFKTDPQGNF